MNRDDQRQLVSPDEASADEASYITGAELYVDGGFLAV